MCILVLFKPKRARFRNNKKHIFKTGPCPGASESSMVRLMPWPEDLGKEVMTNFSLKTKLMQQLHPALKAAPYQNAERFWVAVSGGPDSMALIDVMRRMQHVHGSALTVIHVHHHTGEWAEEGFRLVREYCREYGLELRTKDFHADHQENFEYEASRFRHTWMKTLCRQGGFALTGHHLTDQAETFLMALVRGIGSASPTAMEPEGTYLLRPFLHFERKLILDHLERTGLSYVTDPTNDDSEGFRTALRQEVFPVLNRYHHGAEKRVGRWVNSYLKQNQRIRQHAEKVFEANWKSPILSRTAFESTPEYLWDYLLQIFKQHHPAVLQTEQEYQAMIRILGSQESGRTQAADGGYCYCDNDGLICLPSFPISLPCSWGSQTQFGDWDFTLTSLLENRDPKKEVLVSLGLPFPKLLKERFRILRTPLRIRHGLPGISVGDQTIHFGDQRAASAAGLKIQIHQAPSWMNAFRDHWDFGDARVVR